MRESKSERASFVYINLCFHQQTVTSNSKSSEPRAKIAFVLFIYFYLFCTSLYIVHRMFSITVNSGQPKFGVFFFFLLHMKMVLLCLSSFSLYYVSLSDWLVHWWQTAPESGQLKKKNGGRLQRPPMFALQT